MLGVASTTPSSADDEPVLEDDLSTFDRINDALSQSQSSAVDPATVFEHYDSVIAIYGSESYGDEWQQHVDVVSDAVPGRDAYRDPDYNDIVDLNEEAEGDTLLLAVDLDASPECGEGIPTYKEINNEGFDTEGKWWDHPEQVNADVLIDRTSFYGAVNAPGRANVFEMNVGEGTDQFYLFDNQ